MTRRPIPPVTFNLRRLDVRQVMAQIRRRIRIRRAQGDDGCTVARETGGGSGVRHVRD